VREAVEQTFGHHRFLARAAFGDVGFFNHHGLPGDVAHIHAVAAFAGHEAFDDVALLRLEKGALEALRELRVRRFLCFPLIGRF